MLRKSTRKYAKLEIHEDRDTLNRLTATSLTYARLAPEDGEAARSYLERQNMGVVSARLNYPYTDALFVTFVYDGSGDKLYNLAIATKAVDKNMAKLGYTRVKR